MYKSFLKFLVFLLLISGARWKVFSWTSMLSGSMAPTLKATMYSQDHVLIDKLTLKTRVPQRGEIVHLYMKNPEKSFEYIFKRVVGLPGERLEIRDSRAVINDKVLDDPEEFRLLKYVNEGYATAGVVLEIGSDSYFVMGDNSENSYDSRYWGAVKSEEILGRAALIFWPLNRFGRMFPKE